jgi:hypothetical protein
MMKAAEERPPGDASIILDRPRNRFILNQRQMRAAAVIVVRRCECDEVVDARSTYLADKPFGKHVLPRRARRDRSVSDAQPADTPLHDLAKNGVTISHQISWRFVPPKRLDNLTRNRHGRWRYHCSVANESPPAMAENHEAVERLQTARGHDKQDDRA